MSYNILFLVRACLATQSKYLTLNKWCHDILQPKGQGCKACAGQPSAMCASTSTTKLLSSEGALKPRRKAVEGEPHEVGTGSVPTSSMDEAEPGASRPGPRQHHRIPHIKYEFLFKKPRPLAGTKGTTVAIPGSQFSIMILFVTHK